MLAHHHVPSLAPPDLYRNPLFVTATVAAFASTMCMATFTAISITRLVRIRQRESEALIVQLKQAYLQLGEVERSKSQHMRRVSHELRAPLAAIQNLLTMLEEVMTGEGRSAERELAGRAAKRVNQALKLVGDLTILARSQDARFTARMRELPLGPIIREVVGSLQGRAETEQVAVKVDLADNLPAILGDPESIEQLLTNLTGNAIKYTPPGGQVVVTAERRDEHVLVRVADTGIGIAEDDLPHLFEEFYRGKNARERTEHGTGLGLSIVRSIADMHGADIRVESEIDRGSTFEVMLPRADVAAAKQAQGT
jgi:signal transduction histidine kinase